MREQNKDFAIDITLYIIAGEGRGEIYIEGKIGNISVTNITNSSRN